MKCICKGESVLSLKSKNRNHSLYHSVKNSGNLKPFKSYQVSVSLRTGDAFNVQSMNLDYFNIKTKIFKIKFSLCVQIIEDCQKRW